MKIASDGTPMVTLSVYLPRTLHAQLRRYARKQHKPNGKHPSLSRVAVVLLHRALMRQG